MTATHAQNFTDDQQSYLANAERIAKVAVNRKEPLFRFLRFSSEPEKASVRAALVDRHFRFGRPSRLLKNSCFGSIKSEAW